MSISLYCCSAESHQESRLARTPALPLTRRPTMTAAGRFSGKWSGCPTCGLSPYCPAWRSRALSDSRAGRRAAIRCLRPPRDRAIPRAKRGPVPATRGPIMRQSTPSHFPRSCDPAPSGDVPDDLTITRRAWPGPASAKGSGLARHPLAGRAQPLGDPVRPAAPVGGQHHGAVRLVAGKQACPYAQTFEHVTGVQCRFAPPRKCQIKSQGGQISGDT